MIGISTTNENFWRSWRYIVTEGIMHKKIIACKEKINTATILYSDTNIMPTLSKGLKFDFSPSINLFIGPNSTGKSIFLRSIARRFNNYAGLKMQKNLHILPHRILFNKNNTDHGSIFIADIPSNLKPNQVLFLKEDKMRSDFKPSINRAATKLSVVDKTIIDDIPSERYEGQAFNKLLAKVDNYPVVIWDDPTGKWSLSKGFEIMDKIIALLNNGTQVFLADQSQIHLMYLLAKLETLGIKGKLNLFMPDRIDTMDTDSKRWIQEMVDCNDLQRIKTALAYSGIF